MARTQPLQTSFSSGVLNAGLTGRTDIQHYYQGAKRGNNVICVKEGGARGRWGLQHICDMPGDGRLVPFSFSTTQNYLLWFGQVQMRIVRDDALVTNINGSGNSYLTTPYSLAQALELDYTQSADVLVTTHQDVAPQTIIRGTSHSTWTAAAMEFLNLPTYDFNDADSPTPTDHEATITFNSFDDGNRYKLELNGFETPEIIYSAGSTDANCRRIKDELLALPPTGFDENSVTVTYSSGTTYDVVFSDGSADAYEPMTGRNTDKASASITCTIGVTGSPRREEVISATRGYPAAVTFYESRLYMGGLKSLPQSVIGTIIGGFFPFNFKLGTGLDNQGIFVTINTDQVNAIRALFPGDRLQVFTSGAEFYCPERPITPAGISMPRQTSYGCVSGVKPGEVEGATVFVTKTAKTLREFLFNLGEDKYKADSLTALSSDLLQDVRCSAMLNSTADDEQSLVICLNEDGTGALLNTLRAQDLAAWSPFNTRAGDELRQVCIVGTDIYFLVMRARNGGTVYTIEKATYDTRLDASKTVTTGLGTTVAGFSHLAGETVDVLVDGAPVGQMNVDASGQLTFSTAPTASVEAGYFCPPILETMPLTVNFGGQPLLGATKRLVNIRALVKESLGVVINDELAPDQTLGEYVLGDPPIPFSGVLRVSDMGWTEGESTITLTQTQPLPFHVLGLSAVLEVGAA